MRRQIVRVIMAVLPVAGVFAGAFAKQHRVEIPPPEKISVPEAGTIVAMLDIGGRPIVEVRINGKGPYAFILDTGASATVVSPDLIEELALPGAPGLALHGPVRIEEMRVGEALLGGVTAGRISLIGNLVGDHPPRGVLSASAFPGCLVTLDYPAKKVVIRKGALPDPDDPRVFAYAAEDILPKVPVRVAGHEFRVHVDSGSPGGLTLPVRYEQELPLADTPREIGRGRTHVGAFPIFAATVKGAVVLGEYSLDLKEIHFSDLRPSDEAPSGHVGFGILGGFVVTLDSKNHRVKFER